MWRLVVLGIAVAAIGGFVWRLNYLEGENTRLNTELTSANATVGALDHVNIRNNELYENERNAVDEIDHAPLSDDGPVAPVLRRAITRIDRMPDNSQ